MRKIKTLKPVNYSILLNLKSFLSLLTLEKRCLFLTVTIVITDCEFEINLKFYRPVIAYEVLNKNLPPLFIG